MYTLLLLVPLAAAAPPVPPREIPSEVLVELQQLENRFELALAADCPADVCYAKGCVWLDHAVADQPRASSMPGLGAEAGPDPVGAQPYLTQAECSFAHEPSLDNATAQALVRRLQTRLTRGWTVVTVDQEVLSALPVPEPPAEVTPPVEAPAEPEATVPEVWTAAMARRELWNALLPHFFWMTGIGLVTVAAVTLIWAGRRVGKASIEEQALLAELSQPVAPPPPTAVVASEAGGPDAETRAFVAEQEAAWTAQLAAMDPANPDPELQALVRERLRAGDLPLLAKAVLRFPQTFPALFPSDGEIATAKLELAELLQTVDTATLPDDPSFFAALQRHALAARLRSQSDARIVRSLREDFGATGLVALIGELPPRLGALLFALAPPVEQLEMVRLLPVPQVAGLAQQLLRSNRMDPAETRALFEVLRTAEAGGGAAAAFATAEITDRGATFDAAAALAVLLPRLSPAHRGALYDDALDRSHGTLPAWTRAILTPDMLLALPAESRADLLLELEAEPLAAWFSLVEAELRPRLLAGAPESLRRSIEAATVFPSRTRQLALAGQGRRDLARGFQRQLARLGIPFEQVVQSGVEAET